LISATEGISQYMILRKPVVTHSTEVYWDGFPASHQKPEDLTSPAELKKG